MLHLTRLSTWLVFSCSVLSTSVAVAQDFEGTRLMSLGGAQAALTSGNDSMFINPAGMSHGRTYLIEANYQDDFEGRLRNINGSIMDSQAGPISAGVSYVYNMQKFLNSEGEYQLEGHRVDLAVSSMIVEGFSAGVTSRYINYNQAQNDTPIEGGSFDKFDMDIGLQFRHPSGFAASGTLYNILPNDNAKPFTPLRYGVGVGYGSDMFSIEGDMRYNLDNGKARFMLGATLVIADVLPLRAGGYFDRYDESFVLGGGLGYQTKEFGIDAGYRQRITVNEAFDNGQDMRIFGVALRAVFM